MDADILLEKAKTFVEEKINEIMFIHRSFGGWERWFQLSFAYYLSSTYVVDTEVVYQNRRIDLSIQDENMEDHYVEIKCLGDTQLITESINQFVNGVFEDIDKQQHAQLIGDKYCMVVIPNDINGVGCKVFRFISNSVKTEQYENVIERIVFSRDQSIAVVLYEII